MESLFSMILAVVMAFTSVGGMTATIEDAVSFEMNISMDAEEILALADELRTDETVLSAVTDAVPVPAADSGTEAITEETIHTVKAIGDILNAVTLKGVATKDAAELDLMAGEDAVLLSLGMKNAEEGVTVASTLLNKEVIFVSAEAIQEQLRKQEEMQQQLEQLQQSLGTETAGASGTDLQGALDQMQNLDKEQIAKDCAEVGEKLAKEIEARKGETETGEFTVDGLAFTGRTPVNMTYKEFAELLLNCVRELAAKDSLKAAIQASGTDIDEEISKAIEALNAMETEPEFGLAIFTNADNGVYYVCDLVNKVTAEETAAEAETQPEAAETEATPEAAEEVKNHLAFGDVDGLNRAVIISEQGDRRMDIVSTGTKEGAINVNATILQKDSSGEISAKKDEAGNVDMVCNVKTEKADMTITVKTEKTEDDRIGFAFSLANGDADKAILAITGSAGKGGKLESVFEGDFKVTPITDLMEDTTGATAQRYALTAMAGLLRSVSILTKYVPEESGAWVTNQVKQMINSMMGIPTATKAPQEEPVVDGD